MDESEKGHEEETFDISFNKEELQRRKDEFLKKLTLKKNYLIYIAIAIIAWFGYNIRTKNLGLLQDKYPLALDPYAFLRYTTYLFEHGKLMAIDTMRYSPFGFASINEFKLLSYFLVYLHKFLSIFSPDITIAKSVILYPPIMFVVGLIFFFLLVKKLFNWKVALVSSAFLTVLPTYLYRTMAGFSDKESFAMAMFFMVFYFLVSAWKEEKSLKKTLVFAFLAGLSNGIMGLVWGGISFTYLILGSFTIIQILLNKFDKKYFYTYVTWFVVLVSTLHFGYPERFTFFTFITSTTTFVMIFALIAALSHYFFIQKNFFKLKEKVQHKIPLGIFSLLVPIVFGFVGLLFVFGPSFFITRAQELYVNLIEPFGTTRWALTVAESHQPYFSDWKGQMGWKYLAFMFTGATLLFFETIRPVRKKVLLLTGAFFAFILAFSMSRYAPNSTFNGVTSLSKFTYLGSLVIFIGILLYAYFKTYYHDKETFKRLQKIELNYLFVFLWFFFMIIAARSAIRLLFIFAPITALMVGYSGIKLSEYAKQYLKKDILKIAVYLILIFILGSLFLNFSRTVSAQAQYTGPSFNGQWQQAMSWVQENTPEDAVFAHWWDYGYWVQTGGGRTTLSDGGNALGGINHFVGRHLLTGHSEREALELLKARNATHVLMISDEVGKYSAYSSIGADKDYDRYSWIPTFGLDKNQIMETRNATVYLYTGGTPVDHDIIYKDQLFPANSAGIGGFFVKVRNMEVDGPNGTKQVVQQFEMPEMALFYNGQQVRAPVSCIYFNNQKITFDHPDAIQACLRIIPDLQSNNQINPLGAILYLSPEVAQTNFARLFLMNEQSEYFKLVYTDEDKGMPLGHYNGRLIGPLKIWEVSYPDDLEIPEKFYGTEIPKEVQQVRK